MRALIPFLLFFVYSVHGQTLKLKYEPHGQIIQINYDSLKIYTDANSLHSILLNNESNAKVKARNIQVNDFITKQFIQTQLDTLLFPGTFYENNEGIEKKHQNELFVLWIILNLTEEKKLKIIDKHKQVVEVIIINKIGTKKEGHIRLAYINKETKEELFSKLLYREEKSRQ